MEKISERLSNDFYEKQILTTFTEFSYDPCRVNTSTDPLFYIPFKDDFPALDKLKKRNQKNSFSLLYVQPKEETIKTNCDTNLLYPLQTMFECYKDSIPGYNYSEFKTIILNEFQSTKSDEQIMDSFLETFGYGAIEFLSEIIRHRHNRIDYSVPIFGEFTDIIY